MIVVVTEKPQITRLLAPHLSTKWPAERILCVCTFSLGLYDFLVPRDLRVQYLPRITPPVWKRRVARSSAGQVMELPIVTEVVDGNVLPSDLPFVDALRQASEIICATDPDSTGASAWDVLLRQTLSPSQASSPRPWINTFSLAFEALQSATREIGSTCSPVFEALRLQGEGKRYFDWNWITNAFVLHGLAFRAVGGKGSAVPSKWGIQLLYAMRDGSAATEGELIARMAHWPGSGKYAPVGMGSMMSRGAIVEGLVTGGLIRPDATAARRDRSRPLCISPVGRAFLDHLHQDTCDADLPARLDAWLTEWPRSRPKMERYLRTVFGKQRRFNPAATA